MLTRTLFLNCIKDNKYLERKTLLSLFGILMPCEETEVDIDEGIYAINGKGIMAFGEMVEDAIIDSPICYRYGPLSLKKGELIFIEEDVETTYGEVLISAIFFIYPYKGKLKFIPGYLTPSTINERACKALLDKTATIEEHKLFEKAVYLPGVLTQCGVASASVKSIVPPKDILAYKEELLAMPKYKDHLDDPATVAELQGLLAARYREYIKGDPSAGFFIDKKGIDVARLRSQVMFGAEPDFVDDNKIVVITDSLSQGWKAKDIPLLANTQRMGSYNRGKETSVPGATDKLVTRVTQNMKITIDDCESTDGLEITINSANFNQYVGTYIVGTSTPLTIDKLKTFMGKKILIRSPKRCRVEEQTSYCKKCMGDISGNTESSLSSQVSAISGIFVSVQMAKTHTTALATNQYEYLDRIV